MNGDLYNYFFGDHRELEEALEKAAAGKEIDSEAYDRFRVGILRHIGLEEKVLLPALEPLTKDLLKPALEQIRLDHGAITALMVPPPTHGILRAVRSILEKHNILEESKEGLYDVCEQLPFDVVQKIVQQVRSAPPVKLVPNNPGPGIMDATRRAVERAGYPASIMD